MAPTDETVANAPLGESVALFNGPELPPEEAAVAANAAATAAPRESPEALRMRAETADIVAEADKLAARLGCTSPEDEQKRTKELLAQLHVYNEVKDMAQALLGRLACVEGCTTKQLYSRFNLSLDD